MFEGSGFRGKGRKRREIKEGEAKKELRCSVTDVSIGFIRSGMLDAMGQGKGWVHHFFTE